MDRLFVPVLCLFSLAMMLAYMQLERDHERIDRDTVLLTNHWTSEVRRCHRSQNSELTCRPTTLEPRPWYLALSPFDSPSERAAKKDDRRNPIIDIIVYGSIGLAMLIIFAGPLWDWRTDRNSTSKNADGGSMSHGNAGSDDGGGGGDSGGEGGGGGE
ncbi:hypothetical protein [Rhizobium sp. LCM 4573]|uniref:hypothetical protein n=1 Tax=Rhizobium sp. LCM 4573 TaxID=1848291 RepID=UPI00104228CC|nr:hypothetical protein [Rhizobium sp. LCM 4573]